MGIEDMQQNALDMAQNMMNAQMNAAKVTVSWDAYGHHFAVESMNPISVFTMVDKVKEVAKAKFEMDNRQIKNAVPVSDTKAKKHGKEIR